MKIIIILSVLVSFVVLPMDSHAAGITLTMTGDAGSVYEVSRIGAEIWAKKTGNTVNILQVPKDSNDRLALCQQQLSSGSGDIDVYMIDVVWPGLISQHLLDLTKYIPKEEIEAYFPALVENNTVNGKLIGIPWFTDGGLLFYRTDLLAKYGFQDPPRTWDELFSMAKKIQEGERAANPLFQGFVFQGKNYEGLICDAIEWIASFGGGTIIDSSGKVNVNNPKVIAALTTAKSWVGTIAPEAITTYAEEDSRNIWESGNVAFMRNWPYAYASGQKEGCPIKGKFNATTLPAGPGGHPASALGGWQLAVNARSKHPKEAVELVRYLTGAEEQKRRAITASFAPTIATLYQDPEVIKAVPFFKDLFEVLTNGVARPSSVTKSKYNQVSNATTSAVYSVLTKKQSPAAAMSHLEKQLARIKGLGW